ncbi:hypothetical protein N9O19_06050 [Euryarchaeota archaeon]|jgi:hypothetical protein|nr:hypothetical protein [Euryarchaeota archaeon]
MQLHDVPLSLFEMWTSLPNTTIHISKNYIWATWSDNGQLLDLWLIDEDVAEYKEKYQLEEEE